MEAIKPGTRVERLDDGRQGTTCTEHPIVNQFERGEDCAVVYDGERFASRDSSTNFKILGSENAVPDANRCGMGLGKHCCIFLTSGDAMFKCQRHDTLRWTLMLTPMGAERHPADSFPSCMLTQEQAEQFRREREAEKK